MPVQSGTIPLGETLKRAGLLSPAQLEVVLHDQQWQPDLRIGDILEIRGWVKRDAIEFFAEQWPQVTHGGQDRPIGYYLQQAGLLNSQQVDALLQEQAQAGLRIGALAVLRGWLSQETLDWFLQSLAPDQSMSSAFIKRQQAQPVSRDRILAQTEGQTARAPAGQVKTATEPPAKKPPEVDLDDIPWV